MPHRRRVCVCVSINRSTLIQVGPNMYPGVGPAPCVCASVHRASVGRLQPAAGTSVLTLLSNQEIHYSFPPLRFYNVLHLLLWQKKNIKYVHCTVNNLLIRIDSLTGCCPTIAQLLSAADSQHEGLSDR